MSTEPTEDLHLRRRDLDAEQILKLIQLEQNNRPDFESDDDFNLIFSPLEMRSQDTTEFRSGSTANIPPEVIPLSTYSYSIKRGQQLRIQFSANDINAGTQATTWSRTGVGSINNSGLYTYNPSGSTTLGNKTAKIRAMGRGGNSAYVTITIIVLAANNAPTLATIGNRTIRVGQTLTINLDGRDDDGDDLTYSVVSGDIGNLDPSTGVFTFEPTETGSESMSFRCSDGIANSPTRSTTITIQAAVTNPPVLRTISNKNLRTGQSITITLQSTNPKSQDLEYKRNTGSWQDSPTFSISYSSQGTRVQTMQVRDEDGLTDSITFSVIVRQNNAPTLASIGSKTVRVGQTLTINLDGQDVDTGDELTYFVVSGDVGELDPETGVYTFTPDSTGSESMSFRCNDGLLNSPTRSTTITIQAAQQRPPVLSSVSNKTLNVNQSTTITLQSTNPKGQNLQYKRNTGAWQTSPTFTISYSSAGTRVQTMQVRDEDGLTDSITFSVIVRTAPPPKVQNPTLAVSSSGGRNITRAGGIFRVTWNYVAGDIDGSRITDRNQISVVFGVDSRVRNTAVNFSNTSKSATRCSATVTIGTVGSGDVFVGVYAGITVTGSNGNTKRINAYENFNLA